ncbi:MAG: amidohydrolase [Acetobacteraceae bacterium]|nr:amidohydrolase [Acetobacteraceae bacterium]
MTLAQLSQAIDCDLHPDPPRRADLIPYLDAYWRDTVMTRDVDRLDLTSFPSNATPSRRPDWIPREGESAPDRVRRHVLDRFDLRYAILNCLHGAMVMYNDHFAGALASAVNQWIAHEWLDRDSRLRASITISLQDPERAAEEVARWAADPRFVQVLVLAGGEMPLGRKYYWPIWRAAERAGLAVGIHAGSSYRHAPTQSGFPSYYVEDYVGQMQGLGAQLLSFIAEGVFVAFPALRVVLIESGVTWLPAFMWRLTKDWRGVRTEIPWIKDTPATVIREHVRLTAQPFDTPPDPADLARILDHLGSDDMLLFATDYPHWQFDGDAVLPPGIPERLNDRMLAKNALETYPRLRESGG